MSDKLVVVFVSGGLVQDTRAPEGIQVEVIDYDNLEDGGECPICRGAIETKDYSNKYTQTIMVSKTRTWIDNSLGYPIPVEEIVPGEQVAEVVTITEGGYPYCPACDINWDEITNDQLYERLRARGG